jgi:ribonucleotide monophosphatase NagD (HAD superfamily)
MSSPLPPFTTHFATLASAYDVLLCDVWGVVHNGVAATPESCDALMRFRGQGGTVILVTNAPRPGEVVMEFIDRLKRGGKSVFHIGPARDLPIFEGLDLRLAPIESADYVVCSGLFDDTVETPQDYQGLIETLHGRGLLMICANPDIVVERGTQLVYCAGAVADLYAAAGGNVLYAGKPYRPIYERALACAQTMRGRPIDHRRVLAIGDSVRTDLKGAVAFGIECLFVTAGIHAEEVGGRDSPDPAALSDIFAAAGLYPNTVMRRLEW